MQEQLSILKIGGKLLADEAQLKAMLEVFIRQAGKKILVHGGGNRANELIKALGIEPKMVNGRRITDEPTLEIVTMVYAGSLNKALVARLQAMGCAAIGLSGADANIILAHKRIVKDIDYGFAGDVDAINVAALQHLLAGDLVPVCCAITHDGKGQLLNTNADTIASTLAVALAPHFRVSLQYSFERPGVLRDPLDDTTVITSLNKALYQQYKEDGVITDGMIPKLDNAFAGLAAGVKEVVIGNPAAMAAGRATIIQL
jgi:acetylglutamate kinase